MKLHFAPLGLLLAAGSVHAQNFNEPPVAVDINPDPTIVEVNLTASEVQWQYIDGVDTTVWAYNGTVPGPTIMANRGDTVIVNFTNMLPEETTIHWHGIKTPALMDGSHISQPAIQPGESFTYQFTVNEDKFAWYHPHVRPFDQVEKGLYGGLMVRNPAREAFLGFDAIEEHLIFFDDILLDASNQVVPAFSFTDPLQNCAYQLNGREGNLLLVNGKEAAAADLHVPNGQPQRWRIVNAANTTFCRLDLRNADVGLDEKIWQVGTDGGFIDKGFELLNVSVTGAQPDHPMQALVNQMGEGVFLTPGERMDIIFTPIGNDGETFTVNQADWFRGRHVPMYDSAGNIILPDDPLDGLYPDQKFLDITVVGPDPGAGEFVMPPKFRNFAPIQPNREYPKLPMVYGHSVPDPQGNVKLFVQAEFDPMGMVIPYPAPKINSLLAHDVNIGETWMWEITNLTHGDHNFHTHGFDFQLIEYQFIDAVTPGNNATFRPFAKRQMKDVLRIPPRLGAKGTSKTITRLKVTFDDTGREGLAEAGGEVPTLAPDGSYSSGGWLVHCHILEHSALGMLSFYEVRDPSVTFHYLGSYFQSSVGRTHLSVSGDLSPGSDVVFEIVNGLPNTQMRLVVGNKEANTPFRGGNVVPGTTGFGGLKFLKTYLGTTDANGRLTIATNEWEPAFPGTALYWQVAYQDATLPGGWALSNAVSFVRP